MDLRPVKLFDGMSDSDLRKIERQMREVRHTRGAKIAVRGREGVGFMVILDGEAEVTTPDGRSRPLGPGDHFGEMALLDQGGRSSTVVATTDLVVAAIPEWHFKPFLMEHPEVAYRMLQTLSRRLRDAAVESLLGTEERKMVTVLFADLVESTSLAQKMDPERAREVLGSFFDAATMELQALRGRVEKYIGDAVMAVF